jgi:DNA-binding NarL/FixJ family response regulator
MHRHGLVLSQYAEEDYAFELLGDGVAGLGYLLTERVSRIDELVRALHEVARGGSVIDPKGGRRRRSVSPHFAGPKACRSSTDPAAASDPSAGRR